MSCESAKNIVYICRNLPRLDLDVMYLGILPKAGILYQNFEKIDLSHKSNYVWMKKMADTSQLFLSLILLQSDHDDSRLLSEQTEKWKNVINQNYNWR